MMGGGFDSKRMKNDFETGKSIYPFTTERLWSEGKEGFTV